MAGLKVINTKSRDDINDPKAKISRRKAKKKLKKYFYGGGVPKNNLKIYFTWYRWQWRIIPWSEVIDGELVWKGL